MMTGTDADEAVFSNPEDTTHLCSFLRSQTLAGVPPGASFKLLQELASKSLSETAQRRVDGHDRRERKETGIPEPVPSHLSFEVPASQPPSMVCPLGPYTREALLVDPNGRPLGYLLKRNPVWTGIRPHSLEIGEAASSSLEADLRDTTSSSSSAVPRPQIPLEELEERVQSDFGSEMDDSEHSNFSGLSDLSDSFDLSPRFEPGRLSDFSEKLLTAFAARDSRIQARKEKKYPKLQAKTQSHSQKQAEFQELSPSPQPYAPPIPSFIPPLPYGSLASEPSGPYISSPAMLAQPGPMDKETPKSDSERKFDFSSLVSTPKTENKEPSSNPKLQVMEGEVQVKEEVKRGRKRKREGEGESDLKCKLCNKEFCKPFTLQRHMKRHTGEKPFECKHCHRGFAEKSTLQRHELTHGGERHLKCAHCIKSFFDRTNLWRHEQLHAGSKPFRCCQKDCNKGFEDTESLRQHFTKRHSKEADKLLELFKTYEHTSKKHQE